MELPDFKLFFCKDFEKIGGEKIVIFLSNFWGEMRCVDLFRESNSIVFMRSGLRENSVQAPSPPSGNFQDFKGSPL